MKWVRLPKRRFPPADAVWGATGVVLARVIRPALDGKATGGWWVLYRKGRILGAYEFNVDQWRQPPLWWANKLLEKKR